MCHPERTDRAATPSSHEAAATVRSQGACVMLHMDRSKAPHAELQSGTRPQHAHPSRSAECGKAQAGRGVMNQRSPFWVRHAALVFSGKTFSAAMLALVTALLLDMPRPYWAMAPVYITAQPLVGATVSKAVYRMIGTVIGVAAAVVAIPNLANAPELLCLAIASWVGVCLYLSLLDGTPRSYAFMLAGYTVALIGFPSVSEPGAIFDTAVSRVEEISLGIVCASLVSTIVFPRSVAPAVANRVDLWLADARRLSQAVLLREGTSESRRPRRLKLATDIVEIDTLSTHLAYDRLT